MKQSSPMMYFTPLFKEMRANSDRHLALVDAQTPLVRHLYDELLIDLELVGQIISCNNRSRSARVLAPDALAKTLSRWASTHVFGTLSLPGSIADELSAHGITCQMRIRLKAVYDALLLARLFEPGGLEDRIIRALLDNRPASALECDDDRVIATIDEGVTSFYRNGDPNKGTMLHQAVFLNGALVQFFEKDGRLAYFSHNKVGIRSYRVCPPELSLSVAMHRLLAAFSVVVTMKVIVRARDIGIDVAETRMIEAIRALHAQGPLSLASPQSIYDIDVRQILQREEVCDGRFIQ